MKRQRLLTGAQPSGQAHIGNYFAAIKPIVDMSADYDTTLMVVDYHALTSLKDPKEMRENILDLVKSYLAAGADPSKITLFKQSDVQEHTELAWVFDCLVTVPFLMQGHAYKDKVANGKEANAGLFTYPMLMAADILLYDADVIPVGEDQRQHIEYTREVATKFNATFGDTFAMPKEMIPKSVGVVPGTDGKKMSKSYGNIIPAFGTKDDITKAVMSIVTDSSGDVPANVYAIHKLYKSDAELSPLYAEHKGKYKALKEALIEDIEAVTCPMREKRESITDEDVKRVLKDGAEKASVVAKAKMATVRKKIGVAI